MPWERLAQDTEDLVTVDAREAVPIYETRARKGAEGHGGGKKKKATSRSVFYLSRREKAISHASRCSRVQRSPIRAQMHAGYVVLRVPCAKGYWTWPKGHCSCAASLRSFSVRSLHTPVVTLAKASRYHCVARLGTRAMPVENTRRNTERRIYVQVIIVGRARACARPLKKIGSMKPTLMTRSQINAATCPRSSSLRTWTVRKFYSKRVPLQKRIFPFRVKSFYAIFKCEQF